MKAGSGFTNQIVPAKINLRESFSGLKGWRNTEKHPVHFPLTIRIVQL
jgi:hypothetical protein